jgi:hypothetical protein
MKKNDAVLVTTEFRGIFYGRIKKFDKLPAEITLTKVKNCIYWSADCNGFLGLASKGYTNNCRIGEQVPEIILYKITSVTPCTKQAQKVWEK